MSESVTRVLHADLDAFYASVEQRDDPTLLGRPIAVGGGVILSASYEARRHGVKTAMNEGEARRLCPGLLVVPGRMKAYAEASRAVFAIFEDTSPWVEGLSIDEAFIDVSGLRRLVGTDVEIARRLRTRVADEVGLPLSVGGGSTKFLAKVASAVSKPDGLLIVPRGEELDFLHPLPVGSLWGVGPVARERLASFGINTVGDVAVLDPEILVAKLGKSWGNHLYALANNLDPRTVEVGRRSRSIGSQRSFRDGSVDRPGAEQVLLEVTDRVCGRLRTGNRLARTVVLRLRYRDFAQATRSHTVEFPTNETSVFLSAAKQLLDRAWPEIEDRGLTKVGIAVTNLQSDRSLQLTLPFTKAVPVRLDSAVDEIRDRFGRESLVRTALVGRSSVDMPLLPD